MFDFFILIEADNNESNGRQNNKKKSIPRFA